MPKWKPKLIASGIHHTCLAGDDVIKCWGTPGLKVLTPPRKFKGITQLVSRYSTLSCAKDSKGWECWGYCESGACDIPNDMKYADKLAVGKVHVCGLKKGKVKCWGENEMHQIDIPTDLPEVLDVAVNISHTCVILIDNSVRCWRNDRYGQVSDSKNLINARKIYAGSWFTCIENLLGLHMCTNIVHDSVGKKILSDSQSEFFNKTKFNYFSAGVARVCGISNSKSYVCWPDLNLKVPEIVENDSSLYAVSFGEHVCVLSQKNGISCWGTYENENPNYYKFPYEAKRMMLETLQGE